MTILERIEKKLHDIYIENLLVPTKVYLGKKEFKELNKMFKREERFCGTVRRNSKKATIKALWFHFGALTVVRTKHDSYMRVV